MRVIGPLILAFCLCASQADAATMSRERIACEADARRLCSIGDLLAAYFGDPRPVAHCLIINKAQISPACRAVLRGHRLID
jgi:hypothetical protein